MNRFTVHRFFNGRDEVIGHFTVSNGSIHFDNWADAMNCDIFPEGPMGSMTQRRLTSLLNNTSKSVYITYG